MLRKPHNYYPLTPQERERVELLEAVIVKHLKPTICLPLTKYRRL